MTENQSTNMTRLLIGLMALLLVLVGFAMASSTEAVREATKAQTELSVHAARQNGSFESIQSQLGTLRTYHSTHRGELKDMREEMQGHRKLLDELLKASHELPK